MTQVQRQSIVVMGGGTGIFPVVSALNTLGADVSAIVATSDSGGSTGRIRDEFGFPAVGDVRQSLAALASSEALTPIRSLLLYRFEKGDGLRGHNLGNLILTALQDMTGSTTKALDLARNIFRLHGRVIPVTESSVSLEITYTDGTTAIGEHILDDKNPDQKTICSVRLTPECSVNPAALEVLSRAKHIIIGPGDLYASLLAVLVTPGLSDAIKALDTPILYIANLMTRAAQTHDMSISEHVQTIESTLGRAVNSILINSSTIPPEILKAYAHEYEFPVVDDMKKDPRSIYADLLAETQITTHSSDGVRRSLLRHDQKKVQAILAKVI